MRSRDSLRTFALWLAVLLLTPAAALTENVAEREFHDAVTRVRQQSDGGQHVAAYALAESLLRATEAREGPESPVTLEALELVVEHAFVLRYRPNPETCALAEQALLARERTDGPDSLKLIHTLQLAARCAHRLGDVGRAISLQRRAVTLEERARGPASYDLSVQLNNLSAMLYDAGHPGEMASTMQRALVIREKHLPPDDLDLLRLRNNLAVAFEAGGDLAAARPLFEQVLGGYEAHLGPEHARTGYALNNLAIVLAATGDRAEARALYERALRIRERAVGVNPFEIGETLTNLAELELSDGGAEGARALLERALAIHTRHLRADHHLRVKTLLALAAVHRSLGEFGLARGRDREAFDAVESGEQAEHPSAARALVSLGETELAAGHPSDAVAPLERAVELFRRTLGAQHPRLADARRLLAEALARLGDERSISHAIEAERVLREHQRRVFRTLPERQAFAVRRATPLALGAALSTLVGAPHAPDSLRFAAWDALVRSRGLLLDEMASRRHLDGRGDTTVGRLERTFVTARQREVNLTVRLPRDEPAGTYRARLDEARRDAAVAEVALARASVEFRRELARGQVGLTDVLRALPAGGTLLAYVRFTYVGPSRGSSARRTHEEYAAFVAGTDEHRPALVPLGDAAEIDSLVMRWRRATADPSAPEVVYRRAAGPLRRRLWDPVGSRIGPGSLVFVVTDGALAMVNLATLPLGDAGYLVEAGPTIHHLTTERELVDERAPAGGDSGALIAVGGVDYDAGVVGRSATAVLPALKSWVTPRSRRVPDCPDLVSLRFGALPQTRREIEDICSLWRGDRSKRPARILTGADATEAAFRLFAPEGRVIHLATHGYFLDRACPGRSRSSDSPDEARVRDDSMEDPLVRSGLALAGANARHDPDASADDGIMTAAEIAALDLGGVGWVVLSGCDTGLGSPAAMEGVLGLRRAFQVAGARTVVMSLWGVEDAPTRRWARELYSARLDRGLGAAEAVRFAARALLDAQRAGGLGGHPGAWGAFISSGDWR